MQSISRLALGRQSQVCQKSDGPTGRFVHDVIYLVLNREGSMRCYEWATGCHHLVWGAGRFSGGAESHQVGESQLGGRSIPGSYGSINKAGRHEATVLHKGFLLQILIFRMGVTDTSLS